MQEESFDNISFHLLSFLQTHENITGVDFACNKVTLFDFAYIIHYLKLSK